MDIADQFARCSWTQLLLMVKDRLTDVTDESKLQAMLSDLATIMGKNSQESIKVFQSDVDLANKEERLKDSDFYFRTIVERKDKKIEQLTAKNRHIEQVSSNLLAELEQSLALSANLTKEYNDLKQQFEMRSTKLLNKYILKLEKLLVEEKQTNENLQTSLLAARNEIRELKATQTKLQVVWTANEEENAFLKSKVTCYMDQINMLQKLHNKLQYKNENLINQCDILKTSSRNLNNKLSKLKGNILLFCVLRDVSVHDDVSPRIRIPYANILEVNGIQYRYDNIYWGSGQSLLPSGTTPSSSSGVGGGMYRTNSSRKMRQKEQQQPTAADTILTELEYKVRSAAYGDNHLCILSFGPMSSGKTHTVLGNNQKPGILENIVGSLLRIKEVEFLPSDPQYNNTHYSFAISAIQHYNSNSYDLLLENISKFPEGTSPRHYTKQRADHLSSLCEPIEYTQRHNAIVFKESLTEIPLINIEDMRYAVRRAEANKNIVTSYGKIKSHCIYIVKITRVSTRPPPPGVSQRTQDPSDTLFQDDKVTTVGYINVVDLASTEGSESMKSLVTAKQLHDMQNLVSDLNAICDVLKALSDKGNRAIPYKHSKITQILHPVMTDQSNTVLISHINPIESCLEQSSHSLNLVQKIRSSELYLDDSERIQKETEDLEEEGEEGEGGGHKELPSVSVGGRK